MRRLFVDVLAVGEPGWLATAPGEWSRPAPKPGLRVAVPIWRDPWMVGGSRTFTGDVLTHLGLVNAFGDSAESHPRVEIGRLQAAGADLVLLPDEPSSFTADAGPEALQGVRTV